MIKKILTFIFIGLLTLTLFPKVLASEFLTSYVVTYDILDNGEMQVEQDLSIKSRTNKVFVSSYTLSINNSRIYDVEAADGEKPLKTEVSNKDAQSTIKVFFEDRIIGQNKDLKLTLKYKTKEMSGKNGFVLDVNIPKLGNLENVESYDIRLIVPKKFGPVMNISPTPKTTSEPSPEKRAFTFDKEAINREPLQASFGNFQVFNFRLVYHLTNGGFFPKTEKISLPPDIKGRQKITYESLSEEANSYEIDKDGNYLAVYRLKSASDKKVEVVGSAKVLNRKIEPEKGGAFKELPESLVKDYTKPLKFWEWQDHKISALVKSLKNENETVSQNARRIYDFVTATLKYKNPTPSETVERLGASRALETSDQAICMEFVDLFIAVARGMGIPTRELNGYAYGKSSSLTPLSINLKGGDVLHSWAEFYDPNFGWVQIDPTWGSTSKSDFFTKLDTNHLVFVVKGLSSEFPLPAGSYKTSPEDKSQVDVNFAADLTSIPLEQVNFRVYRSQSLNPLHSILGQERLTVENTGNVTAFGVARQKTVPPHFMGTIQAKTRNNLIDLEFQTFEGTTETQTIKLEKYTRTRPGGIGYYLPVIAVVIAALALYMMFYLLVSRRGFLQKLRNLLFPRPRGPSR